MSEVIFPTCPSEISSLSILTTPINLTLEKAIETINEDELIEVTPKEIRLRKRYLKEHERKKDQRSKN